MVNDVNPVPDFKLISNAVSFGKAGRHIEGSDIIKQVECGGCKKKIGEPDPQEGGYR